MENLSKPGFYPMLRFTSEAMESDKKPVTWFSNADKNKDTIPLRKRKIGVAAEIKEVLYQLIINQKQAPVSITREQWVGLVDFCATIIVGGAKSDGPPKEVLKELVSRVVDVSDCIKIVDIWSQLESEIPWKFQLEVMEKKIRDNDQFYQRNRDYNKKYTVASKTSSNEDFEINCSRSGSNIQKFGDIRVLTDLTFYKRLCYIACANADGKTLKNIKFKYIDERDKLDLCKQAVSKSWKEYESIPSELKADAELAMIACQQSKDVFFKLAPELQENWGVCRVSIYNHPSLLDLEYPESVVNQKMIKDNKDDFIHLFKERLKAKPFAIEYFPSWLISGSESAYRELCEIACENDPTVYRYINRDYQTMDLLLKCYKSNKFVIAHTPEKFKKQQGNFDYYGLCKKACEEDGLFIGKFQYYMCLDFDLYLTACQQNPKAIQFVPEEFLGDILERCPDTKYYIKPNKCCFPRESANRLALLKVCYRESLLFSEFINDERKKELLDFIHHPEVEPFVPAAPRELYTEVFPLDCFCNNPFLEELLFACYKNRQYQPLGIDKRDDLIKHISAEPEFEVCQGTEELLNKPMDVCGGRTLRRKPESGSEPLQHYKFQRKGESLQDLTREGLTCGFFARSAEEKPASVKIFKSRWPGCHRFIKVALDQLPKNIFDHFEDSLEITEDENGKKGVHAYCYMARPEYSRYAHTADDSENPYSRAEKGLTDGIHDIGRLASMGILLTSTLPGYHHIDKNRRWVMFATLMGHYHHIDNDRLLFPGDFEDWQGAATERPDFGYDGLRDIGDYEIFGDVYHLFEIDDLYARAHPSEVMQRIAMANTLCESIIAVCLLYGRLHQDSSDYHYLNLTAITAAKAFIEKVANELLAGLLPAKQKSNLQTMLKIDSEVYDQWLTRTAKELLYWTSRQSLSRQSLPEKESRDDRETNEIDGIAPDDDTGANPSPVYDPNNCYLQHLTNNGRLSEDLYPNSPPCSSDLSFPDDFSFTDGKLSLGAFGRLFPLTALVKGLTRMCTGIFSVDEGSDGNA
ncbi:DUF4116 domain-containing protein [Endozoicomonas sp.]|uniref:DUF4116 domain-containing protein n=1 Tax=Endozoicomonas sp. TaxID=1892382 RepID=UPI002887C2BB|nr:DUF4116 domain-containing protein [Endozoicomonas sp.]